MSCFEVHQARLLSKMFRFPSPSFSWRWVGRSGRKKEWTHEGFWVPVKAELLSTKAWLRSHFVRNQMEKQEQDYQMSKKATKTKHRWQFKRIGVNKTRSCACKLKYLLFCKWFWIFFFFFFTFPKQWVGRAMGNEIFYGDGLNGHLMSL